MEGLENATVTPSVTPTPAAPLAATPAAAPATTPAPALVPAATPAPTSELNGSSSDNSLMGIIKSLNWIEVTFGIIGAAEIKLAELKTEEQSKNTIDAIF